MSYVASNQLPAALTPSQPQYPIAGDNSTADHAHSEQDVVADIEAFNSPFPSIVPTPSFQYNASLHQIDTAPSQAHQTIAPQSPSPLTAGLKLRTDHLNEKPEGVTPSTVRPHNGENPEQTVFNAGLPVRSSSIRSTRTSTTQRSDSLTPASALSSPGIGPLVEMTPLPSPISGWSSPKYRSALIDGRVEDGGPREQVPEPIYYPRSTPKKHMMQDSPERMRNYELNAVAHSRNRSISDYKPEGMQVPVSRNIVVSTSAPFSQQAFSPPDDHMHREQYLAIQRGLAISVPKPPTPPDSNKGKECDGPESLSSSLEPFEGLVSTVYEARTVRGGKLKRWRALRQLGKGTFSNVMLATSEGTERSSELIINEDVVSLKSLVAVKVCEQGPAGGADEKKVEISIKRELEIMKAVHHPSLVQLKAVNMCERQALLVLNYCAGGDLFELANASLHLLTPNLIRRMFTELVGAVRYLHSEYIVHRDIKLESA